MSQNISEKVRRKKIRGNYFEKISEKNPKSLKFGEKYPRIPRKIAGIF
jgi:hypothetical protein